MRARLAIASSGLNVELREILLRDKAPEFLAASAKATVPILISPDRVIDESFDIMLWALKRADPEGWLNTPGLGFDLIAECDGPFKTALDRFKYAVRYDDVDTALEQHNAGLFLHRLNRMLEHGPFLFGADATLADFAILPFVRQFAHADITWWNDQPFSNTQSWLAAFKASDRFATIMTKYTPWKAGDDVILFP